MTLGYQIFTLFKSFFSLSPSFSVPIDFCVMLNCQYFVNNSNSLSYLLFKVSSNLERQELQYLLGNIRQPFRNHQPNEILNHVLSKCRISYNKDFRELWVCFLLNLKKEDLMKPSQSKGYNLSDLFKLLSPSHSKLLWFRLTSYGTWHDLGKSMNFTDFLKLIRLIDWRLLSNCGQKCYQSL